ncbi:MULTISPECIES: hypothetical protein [unclassified Bacillus (in: firmicutes)]|uniref:hypothetical protein n=1 Tax=unclassified Bacillus (in: firmicutes) TaxID=185979 RepID=UPI0023DBAE5F|nr:MULTISPECIES: hypothetical protein [unclassified Bacillus (in: firmicutes)]MCU4760089.1 hypothetical protein [Bacillus cereus]MCU5109548.1 hypothetical protein [Bacillus cereus]MCU5342881.1 hypothetical protein [Bacillus cereus]MDF2018467.1 hypothetical protein [Bacillus sp. Cr_R3]MDF2032955.1 hypothetical protein [Bacillus sp. Cr_R16]
MKKKATLFFFLNIVIIGMLIFNLFVFTTRMPFLPWFIEDGWGYLGLVLTSFVLLIISFKSYQLYKNGEITILQISIPLVSAMFSLFVMFMPLNDFMTIFSLIVDVSILIICLISFRGTVTSLSS